MRLKLVLSAVLAWPLTAPVLAQQTLPPARRLPVTAPIRDAGTVDVTTGRWTRPSAAAKAATTLVFDNTCTWTTQAYYAPFGWCDANFDEGRIPGPSDPNAPAGAQVSNAITHIQFGYCTEYGPQAGVGGYDMDLAFWDKLGGDCLGFVPPTPPPASSTATAWLPLAGLGLPGSTGLGFLACWTVTLDTSNAGIVLLSDGEGTFDGVAAEDKFIWMQRQHVSTLPWAIPLRDGFLIAGEPASAPSGACTYSIPCGNDAFTGETCGTGLDTFDGSWVNIDGIGVGSTAQPAGCADSVAQYGFGTNCYAFGGYPTGPFASYSLELGVAAGPLAYCTQTKPTSVPGCSATLSVTDPTLASGLWSASDIPRQAGLGAGTVLGIFIYTDGAGIGPSSFSSNVTFGTLCLSGFKRSAPACAPATLPNAQAGVCNAGPMTTAVGCNGGALGIAVGEDVNVQLWYRDPGAAGNANFSNAVFYTVQ